MSDRDKFIEDFLGESGDDKGLELFKIGKKVENGEQLTEEELDTHTARMLQLLTYPIIGNCKNIPTNALLNTVISSIVAITKVCDKRTNVPFYTTLGKAIAVYAEWEIASAKKGELNG